MNPRSYSQRAFLLAVLALFAGASFPAGAVVPGEVTNLQIAPDGKTLSWDLEPQADHYNVYRGYLMELSDGFYGTTLDAELTTTPMKTRRPPSKGTGSFTSSPPPTRKGKARWGCAAMPRLVPITFHGPALQSPDPGLR